MQANNTEFHVETLVGQGHEALRKLLAHFDLPDAGGFLDYAKFRLICHSLFPPNEIEQDDWRIRNIFDLFDNDHDDLLKGYEWETVCKWLETILNPVSALLIVDVQNDFIDGTLALPACKNREDCFKFVESINRLLRYEVFDTVIYSMDWHPKDHISFFENVHLRELHPDSKVTKENAKVFDTVIFSKPYWEQTLWPKHCVQHTRGAELHKDLVIAPLSKQVFKGTFSEEEAYSVFREKNFDGVSKLEEILLESEITQLFVCGLAYDICVKETCLDGLRMGYTVAVVDDCCRCLNIEDTKAAKRLIAENGGLIVESDKARSLVYGTERSLILSHQTARKIASISFPESTTIAAE
ncbi:nicotinamidase [Lasioglossum baleicum]|uniref:nicotinamidase n=1 Tax=Lasioglossum baleicum TaxID=434251 RepID=UPI003FCE9B2B